MKFTGCIYFENDKNVLIWYLFWEYNGCISLRVWFIILSNSFLLTKAIQNPIWSFGWNETDSNIFLKNPYKWYVLKTFFVKFFKKVFAENLMKTVSSLNIFPFRGMQTKLLLSLLPFDFFSSHSGSFLLPQNCKCCTF